MHAEKVSETVAHFIGLFDALIDEMRMRQKHLEGKNPLDKREELPIDESANPKFASAMDLLGYAPGVGYLAAPLAFDQFIAKAYADTHQDGFNKLAVMAGKLPPHHFQFQPLLHPEIVIMPELAIHAGPGSIISHILQANVLRDDDTLNMTDTPAEYRDTSYVIERLGELAAAAETHTPFSTLMRTDNHEKLQDIAFQVREFRENASESESANASDEGGNHSFVLTADEINGIFINGEEVDEIPVLKDHLPDRGLAKPAEEPDDSQTSVEQIESGDNSANSVEVTAGANLVGNIATIVETGIIAPVWAVMGDYHQIDVISQSYAYSDHDVISGALGGNASSQQSLQTLAQNIAIFDRKEFQSQSDQDEEEQEGAEAGNTIPVFPNAWHVSVLEGDVSFIHWIEQYNFVSDNDTMTITTSGVQTTVLTGGNTVINLADYFGFGMQYDLVIVGGYVLDMNIITQMAILYDNDRVHGPDTEGDYQVQTSGNLIWNLASIENVGSNERFEPMPDYIVDTVSAIDNRDPIMPAGLASNPNFEGYAGLNVLYITGNLYDINIIKQITVVGDADDVTYVANSLLTENPEATVTIDTGSNALVNVAQIIDYDSLGSTTYVGGQVYSDAVLIQGGLVDNDPCNPDQLLSNGGLANEVIAFLDDNEPLGGAQDGVIDAGNDFSWSNGHVPDVMQTVIA